MIRPIVTHPDPVLRKTAAPVLAFDEALKTLVRDMFDTMYDAPGRGLAAPQVGVLQRIFVTDTTWKDGARTPLIFVNPEISGLSDDRQSFDEGCLSIPGKLTPVSRPARVRMRWQDLEGASHAAEFEGFAAACVQHELDHLNGVLCIDYADGAE